MAQRSYTSFSLVHFAKTECNQLSPQKIKVSKKTLSYKNKTKCLKIACSVPYMFPFALVDTSYLLNKKAPLLCP